MEGSLSPHGELQPRHEPRAFAAVALALVTFGLQGCAELRSFRHPELVQEHWEREIRRRGVDPAGLTNPLHYTDEMRRDAQHVAGAGSTLDRLRALQSHLFNEKRFPFDYETRVTLTAVEAFESHSGNCVSFTNLFIALARSLGLPVRAALVTRPGDVEKEGELIVVNNHVVAVYEHSGGATVFDFNQSTEHHRVGLRIIGDAWMTAIYLNNRGAEELLAGRPEAALGYLDDAVRLAPDFTAALGNLGVVRRRLDDVEGAFQAYRAALEVEPRYSTILANLAVLYRSQGREAEARAALRAADLRGATPYMLIIRGDFEMGDGRVDEALRLYRQAARLGKDLPDPHLAVARGELARGRPERARRALLRVLAIEPENPMATRLMKEIAGLDSASGLSPGSP